MHGPTRRRARFNRPANSHSPWLSEAPGPFAQVSRIARRPSHARTSRRYPVIGVEHPAVDVLALAAAVGVIPCVVTDARVAGETGPGMFEQKPWPPSGHVSSPPVGRTDIP